MTDVMCSEVTFWRPKIGTSIKRKEDGDVGSIASETAQKMKDKILRILSFSPTLTIKEVADLCGLTYDGAKYHFTALKKSGKLERSGGDKCGSWVVKK